MRYRWMALGIILAGFLAITWFHNEASQSLLITQVADPEQELPASSATYGWLDTELRELRRMRALLDTMEAVGLRTELGAQFRAQNRASIEQMERLKMLTFLQDALWRQTLYNLIWAVFAAVGLLPVASLLDERHRSRRSAGAPAITRDGPG